MGNVIPEEIQVPGLGGGAPGAPGGAPAGPEGAPSAGSVSSPPAGDQSDILRQIVDLFNQYLQAEQDDEDLALASDLQAKTQKLLAQNQKLVDTATGAGPGAKLVRKSQGGGGGY